MGHRWTHDICESCWKQRNPGREPVRTTVRTTEAEQAVCCFCGKRTAAGICVREDMRNTICKEDGK
jgi:hypothetical protein